MKCPNCDEITDDDVCPQCGTTIVSDPDAKLDELVERASRPSLATLFTTAQKRGLIQPTQQYGNTI